MTFLLEFDLLMIEVCTFIQKKNKKTKNKKKRQNKKQKKQKKNKTKKKRQKKTKKKRQNKKKQKKKKKKKCKDMFMSHILLHWVFVVGFIIRGLGEIFMRDELCESSLRSFGSWMICIGYES